METPDFNPEDEQSVATALEREFVRPCATFQNRPLWPFTPGSKALYAMVISDDDTRLYRVLAFLFIHIRRGGKDMESDLAANVVPLVWGNMDLFRMKVLSLCDSMSDADLEEAIRIVGAELKLEQATEITATPPDLGGAQKKSVATTPRSLAGKRSRPQKNLA